MHRSQVLHRVLLPLVLLAALAMACGTDQAPDTASAAGPGPAGGSNGAANATLIQETAPGAEPAADSVANTMVDSMMDQETLEPSSGTFVARAAARSVTLTGFTRPRTSLDLVSEEAGRCVFVAVEVGDVIGEDGIFARLDTTFLELDLEANRADQARLMSDVAFYRKEADRYKALVAEDNAAQSTLDSHQRNLAGASQQLRALRVEEQRLLERIERSVIKAPPGWRVSAREIEEGEWVTVGQTVGRAGNFQTLLVPFLFSLTEYEALKQTSHVHLTLTELGRSVPAVIERVSPDFDPETRKISVDLEIESDRAGAGFEPRGGIRAQLVIPLPDPGGAIEVPRTALLKAYEEHFLVRPDGVRVKVLLLGSGSDEDTYRVSGAEAAPGDVFLVNAQGL